MQNEFRHNIAGSSYPRPGWRVTELALQLRLGLLSQQRLGNRSDHCHHFGGCGQTITLPEGRYACVLREAVTLRRLSMRTDVERLMQKAEWYYG